MLIVPKICSIIINRLVHNVLTILLTCITIKKMPTKYPFKQPERQPDQTEMFIPVNCHCKKGVNTF